MIVTCSNCATRLQLDDAKIPARPFTVRCPKCQTVNTAQPPASATNGTSDAGSHALADGARLEQAMPAPVFELEEAAAIIAATPKVAEEMPGDSAGEPGGDTNELARVLAALLERGASSGEKQRSSSRLAWERRRALVCIEAPAHRDAIARLLAQNDYQVYVAENVTQAIERMRERRMDVVFLDPDFDAIERGAAFVTREVDILRPAERRRLFLVRLTATARTGDAHAAFINNVNLIVNSSDIENMPRALERAIRDYNELYADFNNALNVAAL